MKPQPTIRDVASMAGVSIATVSRVLNKNQHTAPALRSKVLEAVKALKYSPNPAMAAMAARHFHREGKVSGTPIAYVTQLGPEKRKPELQHHWEPFRDRAIEMGYQPDLYIVDESTRAEAFARMLYHRGCAGIVLDRLNGDLGFFRRIKWNPFCVVSMERRLLDPAFDTVRPEIFGTATLLWNNIINKGYKRVGFVMLKHRFSDGSSHPDDVVRAAFLDWAEKSGFTVPPFFHEKGIPFEAPEGFWEWVRNHAPDVVVGFNSVVYAWLGQLGLKVPSQIGFSSLNNLPSPKIKLSGIVEPRDEIARAAADRMDFLFRHGMQGVPVKAIQILLGCTWTDGKTLRRPA